MEFFFRVNLWARFLFVSLFFFVKLSAALWNLVLDFSDSNILTLRFVSMRVEEPGVSLFNFTP
jgi:hypothetical protein